MGVNLSDNEIAIETKQVECKKDRDANMLIDKVLIKSWPSKNIAIFASGKCSPISYWEVVLLFF